MTRARAAGALVLTIALGLASRRFPLGVHAWDKSAGDVLYAVAAYLALAALRPGAPPAGRAAVAFAACFAIELFQLTGVPARLPRVGQLVLGTTFAWHDVACYAAGALAAAATELAMRRSRHSPAGGPRP